MNYQLQEEFDAWVSRNDRFDGLTVAIFMSLCMCLPSVGMVSSMMEVMTLNFECD